MLKCFIIFMRNLILILGFAIFSLFFGINVLSKFTGQHYFIPGSNIDCSKCHPSQAYYLTISEIHNTSSGFTCRTCHNVSFSNNTAHAATTITCLSCHVNIADNINNSLEAHRDFILFAEKYGLKKGPNEACIACHTTFPVKLVLNYYEWINYTVFIDNVEIEPLRYNYTIVSFNLGPKRNYTVIKDYGYEIKSSHYWINPNKIKCTACHKRILQGVLDKWSPGSTPLQGMQHTDDVGDRNLSDRGNNANLNFIEHIYDIYISKTNADNESFCKYCHLNPQWNIYPTYNSSSVHAALKLSCLTCHNESGPYPPSIEEINQGGHYSPYFYQQVWKKVPRQFHGDFCSGCHHYNNHDVTIGTGGGGMGGNGMGGGRCSICHGNRGGYVTNKVYTEPYAYEANIWIYRELR